MALSLTSPLKAQNPPELKDDRHTYVLAVLPQFPPLDIYRRWAPFVERLSKELGVNIQLRVYEATSQFEDDIMNGVPDFAFMNPYEVVVVRKTEGYIPLVRDKKTIKGMISVRKDSPIQSIKDLNGKRITFVSSKTICSLLLRRGLSTRKEKIHFIPQYVGTASNVYRNVILGKASAGGTLDTSFKKEPDEVRSQLRTIYETPPIASHPLAAHPRVPENLRQAVIDAVLRLARERDNHDMLNRIQMPEPVKADYKRDYMPLERLGLGKFIVNGAE